MRGGYHRFTTTATQRRIMPVQAFCCDTHRRGFLGGSASLGLVVVLEAKGSIKIVASMYDLASGKVALV